MDGAEPRRVLVEGAWTEGKGAPTVVQGGDAIVVGGLCIGSPLQHLLDHVHPSGLRSHPERIGVHGTPNVEH